MKALTIFIISPDKWRDHKVSKHHYAIHLCNKGHNVYFIEPSYKNCRLYLSKQSVHVFCYKPRWPGIRFMPQLLSQYIINFELNYISKQVGRTPDLIWNFDSSRLFNCAIIRKKIFCIAHIVDLSENFNRKLLSKTSDVCLSSSQPIFKSMVKYNKHCFNIGHAYPPQQQITLDASKTQCITQSPFKFRIGYAGNLNIPYIDWQALTNLIKAHPDTGFFFLGAQPHNTNTYKRLKNMDNTHFLGQRNPTELPAYYALFDVLLVVYKSQKYAAQLSNPHKILEYLGAGKVILATWTQEYANKQHLLEMVKHPNQLSHKLEHILQNLSQYNSPRQTQARIRFAKQNSYDSKIKVIENIIARHTKKHFNLSTYVQT